MLEGVDILSKRSSLSKEDVAWAQSVFQRLYGVNDANRRFAAWAQQHQLELMRHSGESDPALQ